VDDLRWILLLIGAVVIAGVYFSSRFEGENWKRERASRISAGHKRREDKGAESLEPTFSETPEIGESVSPKGKEPSIDLPRTESAETVSSQQPEAAQASPVAEKSKPMPEETAEVTEEAAIIAPVQEEVPSTEQAADMAEPAVLSTSLSTSQEGVADLAMDLAEDITYEQFDVLGMEPLVLIISILAHENERFKGERIKQVLEGEDFRHGDMDIFHYRREGVSEPIFSIANIVEPGSFDPDKMAELDTPGLTLFCQLPGPMSSRDAFDLMLGKAEMIAHQLGGRVCDDKRNLLTQQTIAHYRERINQFGIDVTLAMKKASQKDV
jgi:cell division protein ZipA